jgi:HTH-type transcriptional regulator/antitoxin HigA
MKVIKTPEQHDDALACVAALASRGDDLTTKEQEQLEVLVVLIEKYENDKHAVAPPSAVEAIRFRMKQMGYRQKDLAAILGGASRASEIMNNKRSLSLEMIRRLHDDWRIPLNSLIARETPEKPEPEPPGPSRDPGDYPMKQMYDRGYFPGRQGDWKNERKDPAGLLQTFFPPRVPLSPALMHLRQGGGAHSTINPHALEAWSHRVLVRADAEQGNLPAYRAQALDSGFLSWLASLSPLADGPRLACEELREKGVAVLFEPRLDHTHLDGAALLADDGRPVIGITLRHNRLDNFWFTLFHELGHVLRHLSAEHPALLDPEIERRKTSKVEMEADRFALDTCIPPEIWEREVKPLQYAKDIRAMAGKLRLHPAILAGRLRHEANDYRLHRTLIGNKQARAALGINEEAWPK